MEQSIAPFVKGIAEQTLDLMRRRVRICMSRLAHNAGFPEIPDGLITVKGQPGIKAYWGTRWRSAYKDRAPTGGD